MVLEFTKFKYHIIFFNHKNSNSVVPQWQNWWGTRVSETRVLEKVVLYHLFPKQCFFAKNFYKMWYWAILALKLEFFLFQSGTNISAEIWYILQYGQNDRLNRPTVRQVFPDEPRFVRFSQNSCISGSLCLKTGFQSGSRFFWLDHPV